MNTGTRNTITRISAYFMLLLISCLIANNALYIHRHIGEDGSVVSHAHPYSKHNDSVPGNKHEHSKSELVFIGLTDILVLVAIVSIIAFVSTHKTTFVPENSGGYSFTAFHSFSGRAPPYLLVA
jgi:hypothetical protein